MLETCERNATLVEALDKVLEKGAVVSGEVAISVAAELLKTYYGK